MIKMIARNSKAFTNIFVHFNVSSLAVSASKLDLTLQNIAKEAERKLKSRDTDEVGGVGWQRTTGRWREGEQKMVRVRSWNRFSAAMLAGAQGIYR
jgi:hypothetical protein